MMAETLLNSSIYQGVIKHRRFSQKRHQFQYRLYMLLLDLNEVEKSLNYWPLGKSWFHPMRFVEKDYVKGEQISLTARINQKLLELGGKTTLSIQALVQVRCFGLYFSPVNFFYCYDEQENCTQILVEVSNTPWNQRHYYLLKLEDEQHLVTEKRFHVSPFMDLEMNYIWRVRPPTSSNNNLLVHIENIAKQNNEKLFDATLLMQRQPLTKAKAFKLWLSMPVMTLKIVAGIYFQALKLFIKRIKFVPYQKYQG